MPAAIALTELPPAALARLTPHQRSNTYYYIVRLPPCFADRHHCSNNRCYRAFLRACDDREHTGRWRNASNIWRTYRQRRFHYNCTYLCTGGRGRCLPSQLGVATALVSRLLMLAPLATSAVYSGVGGTWHGIARQNSLPAKQPARPGAYVSFGTFASTF